MTVSGPETPEPRPSDPGVRTDSPVPSPLSHMRLRTWSPSPYSSPSRDLAKTRLFSQARCSAQRLSLSLSTGQLSRAAAEGGQRAVQMRGLRGRPDRLHTGPESRRDAPGPGHFAPKQGCLPPQAGEGIGLL